MTKNLALGVGAWSLAALLLAGTARAVPEQDIVAGAGGAGFANPAAPAFVGMDPFSGLRAVNLRAGIPVGGAVLLTVSHTTTAPIVEVADLETPNTTLGGTIRQLELSQYWIWVPSAPFVAGKTYQIRLSALDLGAVTDTFQVVSEITLSQPRVTSEPSVSSFAETTSVACCREFFGEGVLEQSVCFPSQQRRSMMLNPGLSSPDPAMLLGQFLFRIRPGGDATRPNDPAQWPTVAPVMFYEQAPEYCFDLEAIELVSGTVHSYPNVARCAMHGQLPEIGTVDIVPGPGELDRTICEAPPLAYEQPWCELNAEPCASDPAAPGCGLYGYVCRDEALPPDPLAGPSGFAGFQGSFGGTGDGVSAGGGGFGALAGAGGRGGRSGGTSASNDVSDDGCTVASGPAPARGRGLLAWCASACLLGLFVRRRALAK